MNNECGKEIFVSEICDNNDEYECLAVVKKISNLRKLITVGESIASDEFWLIFPNSIGRSKWKLSFFPNGQYVHERASAHAGIYLILLSCENKDATLNADITFRFKPQTETEHDGFLTRLNTEFVFSLPSKRWIGKPDFVVKKWLSSTRCESFIVDDTLIISFSIKETFMLNVPTICSEKSTSSNDGNLKDPEWTAVNRNKKKQKPAKKKNVSDAPEKKNNNQRKKKKKPSKGGKKK